MRAVAILLVVLFATSAAAAPQRAPAVDAAGLRGPVPAGDPGAGTSSPTTAAARLRKTVAPPQPIVSTLPADGGQCRQACAHTYYRCLAGDYAEQCPQAWTLCRADCVRAGGGLR